MSKKVKNSKKVADITQLNWGLFGGHYISWWRNFTHFFKDLKIYHRRKRFLLKNGYPESAIWETYYWFIYTMKSILTKYRDTRNGSPMLLGFDEDTCHDEWTQIINRMLELLDEMDETNVIYKDLSFEETDKRVNEAKERFFILFSEYFYALWD